MFAAIYIPDFPVEAILRVEPELRERAVAVVEGAPPLVRVVAVNERAAQAGVEPGMTKLEAEERLVDGRWPMVDGKQTTQGTVRQRSMEREAAAHAALLDCACGFSPQVEDTAADTVVLDVAGLERIFGPASKLARDVARRCSEMGVEANVAVASNPDTAVLAARGFAGVTMIPEGAEAQRLGELSVEVLIGNEWSVASGQGPAQTQGPSTRAPSQAQSRSLGMTTNQLSPQKENACSTQRLEILETLERWGVRNLRALAALPQVALAERLGQQGLCLQNLARGEVRRALVVAEPPLIFEEATELEYPVETLEPLAFLLNRMLEQLCARLAARSLATNELKLQFEIDLAAEIENPPRRHGDAEKVDGRWSMVDGNTDERNHKSQIANQQSVSPCLGGENRFFARTLRLPVPMMDPKVFLKLLQLDLQAHPPQAPVTKVWLRAEPAEPRRTQNGLFVPEAPEAEKLSVTLARIERVVGKPVVPSASLGTGSGAGSGAEPRVGSPEILDTHRADGWRIKPFAAGEGARGSTVSGNAQGGPGEASGPTVQENRQSTIGSRTWDGQQHARGRERGAACMVALRVFRPALPAVVVMQEGKPAHVASPERPTMRGEVVWCAGPWRSSGEWWTEQAWSRQEWDVAVRNEEGVALYRISHDEAGRKWWVEGTYD